MASHYQDYWDRFSAQQKTVVRAATRELFALLDKNPNLTEEGVHAVYQALVDKWGTVAAQSALIALENSRVAAGQWELLPKPDMAPRAPVEQIRATCAYGLHRADKDAMWAVARSLAGPLGRLVQQRARETVWEATNKAGTYFARMPGPFACPFCLMLASRGAVYTRETVVQVKKGTRSGEPYHDNCDCTPMEVYSPESLPSLLKELRDEWREVTWADGEPAGGAEAQRRAWKHHIRATRPTRTSYRPRMNVPAADKRPELGPNVRRHVLDGERDTRKGGHRAGTGRRNKTEFPAAWSDDDVMDAVEETLANPHWSDTSGDCRLLRRVVRKQGQRVIVEAQYYVPEPDGQPVFRTCFPVCGDGVNYNRNNGKLAPDPYNPARLDSEDKKDRDDERP